MGFCLETVLFFHKHLTHIFKFISMYLHLPFGPPCLFLILLHFPFYSGTLTSEDYIHTPYALCPSWIQSIAAQKWIRKKSEVRVSLTSPAPAGLPRVSFVSLTEWLLSQSGTSFSPSKSLPSFLWAKTNNNFL